MASIRIVIRIVLGLLVAYALYLAFFYWKQEWAIFAGSLRPTPAASGPGDSAVEQVWLTTADGARVEAWFLAGAGCTAASPGPAIVYFHGNLDSIDDKWYLSRKPHEAGVSFLMIEYRGYGRSSGKPREKTIVPDAVQFVEQLAARSEVDSTKIVFWAQSVGGAIAIQTAAQRPPRAMVLEATFTNMDDMAARWFVPRTFCRNPFRSDQTIGALDLPILMFHGRGDWMIPIGQGRRLQSLARDARLVEFDGGHANFPDFWEQIEPFLRERGVMSAARP